MPRSTVCPTPGCPNLAPCPDHKRIPWAGSHSHGFPTPVRRAIINRDRTCTHPGCTAPATEADHIIEVADGGTNTVDNGQGLCHTHHLAKTLRHATAARAAHQPPRG